MPTQTLQCDDIQPWLAAYALGEIADDPAARAHLAACPKCQSDLREYRAVAAMLPYAAPEVAPPAELRDRVIAAVTAASGQPSAPAQKQPRQAWFPRLWPPATRSGWAAMAFALVSLVLLAWNLALQSQLARQSNQLVASGRGWQTVVALLNDESLRWYTISGDQANGHFWATPQGELACLVAQQLPALPEGQVYQVWLTHGAEVADGGTFEARNGDAWTIIRTQQPIADYSGVFVTIEPDGGSVSPTGKRVLDGAISGGTTASMSDRLALEQQLGH